MISQHNYVREHCTMMYRTENPNAEPEPNRYGTQISTTKIPLQDNVAYLLKNVKQRNYEDNSSIIIN